MASLDEWKSWPRRGELVVPPPGTTVEGCFEVCWLMSCEKYGIDPDNPPPMRKDVVRKSWRRRGPGA